MAVEKRERMAAGDAAATKPLHDDAVGAMPRRRTPAENAIRWMDAPRAKKASTPVAVASSAVSESASTREVRWRPQADALPALVQGHFVQVGRSYYFKDGARAFTDRGAKLSTPSENTQLIRDLVAIAQARGWLRIAVSGSERFRREAWEVAREAGLEVKGYRASSLDEARLARRMARSDVPPSVERNNDARAASAAQVREPTPGAPRQHVGRLIEHGVAPYQHDPHEPMSYFVRLETQRGEREVWGVDLERAFRESLSRPQPGDEVVVRAVRRDPVTVKRGRTEAGETTQRELATHRNRWSVEKQQFLEQRERAAEVLRDPAVPAARGSRQHPELLGAYLQMHAAEIASRRFRDPQDRERFVAVVRSALADSVARGEPLPAVRMRQSEVERRAVEQGRPAPDRMHRDRER